MVNGAYIGQVILGLLLVLLAIFAVSWLLRRVGQGGLLCNAEMKVIGSLPLSTRERVVLIEVGEQQILLGVAPGRVNTLQVFSSPIIDSKAERELSPFAQKIRDILNNKGPVS